MEILSSTSEHNLTGTISTVAVSIVFFSQVLLFFLSFLSLDTLFCIIRFFQYHLFLSWLFIFVSNATLFCLGGSFFVPNVLVCLDESYFVSNIFVLMNFVPSNPQFDLVNHVLLLMVLFILANCVLFQQHLT